MMWARVFVRALFTPCRQFLLANRTQGSFSAEVPPGSLSTAQPVAKCVLLNSVQPTKELSVRLPGELPEPLVRLDNGLLHEVNGFKPRAPKLARFTLGHAKEPCPLGFEQRRCRTFVPVSSLHEHALERGGVYASMVHLPAARKWSSQAGPLRSQLGNSAVLLEKGWRSD